tara:strand:+ start:478 stop:1842 length:1365 start_codon:yes stop_codon:yes gene_type:complete
MGFNFGAFLGGAASQIVEDIDEQEKEIKLRTRNILDRQVAQTLANQKEYKAKKEKVSNQLNALVPLFGDDPDALAKARSIVAGGDNHYNFMFNKLTQAQDAGQNVNEIYSLIPNKDAVGFKNVEDATNSLVTMAELPEIKLGETTGMAKLFGLDQKRFYEKERKILEEAGQIQSATAGVPEKGVFAQGKLDLGKMKKAFKSSDEYEMSLINERDKFEPGSAKYIELDEKYKKFRKDRATTSASYITNEMINKNKKNPGAVSFRNFLSSYELKLKELEDQGEFLTIDGKQYSKRDPEYKAYVKQETDAYKKKFVENILNDVDGGVLNTNGMALIKANPDLQEIAIQIQKEQKDDIGKPEKKVSPFKDIDEKEKAEEKSKANELAKKKMEDFKKANPIPQQGIQILINQGDKNDKNLREDVLDTAEQIYPNIKREDLIRMIMDALRTKKTRPDVIQ